MVKGVEVDGTSTPQVNLSCKDVSRSGGVDDELFWHLLGEC
jgi:hypothetical protein